MSTLLLYFVGAIITLLYFRDPNSTLHFQENPTFMAQAIVFFMWPFVVMLMVIRTRS